MAAVGARSRVGSPRPPGARGRPGSLVRHRGRAVEGERAHGWHRGDGGADVGGSRAGQHQPPAHAQPARAVPRRGDGAGRRARGIAVVPSARRHLAVHIGRPARGGARRLRRPDVRRRRVGRHRGAGQLDGAGLGPAALHEHRHALPPAAARGARREPDRAVPHLVPRPQGVEGTADRPAHRRRGERRLRLRERRAGGDGQGQPAGIRVRHHRPRARRSGQHPGVHGRALVRRQPHRGPGPVVDGWPAP